MKSPHFSYSRPHTLIEVFDLLDCYGDDACILAGGQSLIPSLNMRLSSPVVLIDINCISELNGIHQENDGLRIGALARHYEVENSPLVAEFTPLLSMAMPFVAHTAIRSRGTFGGSLALADAAAEIPALMLAHDGIVLAESRHGQRQIPADEFFLGLYSTALESNEIITGATFTRPPKYSYFVFKELARRHGDYATAGVSIAYTHVQEGVDRLKIVYFGVADRPIGDFALALKLVSAPLTQENILNALEYFGKDLELFADVHHDVDTKLHLLKVLLKRALLELHWKIQNA